MPTTMDQLQQLNNSQLCMLCYNYYIAPRHVANLNRRQLERRLHVAIIAERAKWRARNLLYSFQGSQRPGYVNAWQNAERPNNGRRDLTLSEWRYLAAHERAARSQRYRGGDELQEQLEQLQELAEYEPDVEPYEIQQQSEPEAITKYSSDHQMQPREQNVNFPFQAYTKYSSEHQMQPSVQATNIAFRAIRRSSSEHQMQPPEQNANFVFQAITKLSSEHQMQPSVQDANIAFEHQHPQILLSEYYTDWSGDQDQDPDPDTEYFSFYSTTDSGTSITVDDNGAGTLKPSSTHCEMNQLQKAERFTGWEAPMQCPSVLTHSEPEPNISSERELCTVNYLSQDEITAIRNTNNCGQLLKLISQTQLRKEIELIGDALTARRIRRRRRPTFWRYLLNLLCCNAQGKLDAQKLRYTLLCCAMVVCTYVGVKMLQ